MSHKMKAIRVAAPGADPVVELLPIPEPGPGQVLVRMAATPINPSDLSSLGTGYMAGQWPFTPGLEGSGKVVKAGPGLLPALRKGKNVACSPLPGGDGTWAEYLLTSATRVVPLSAGMNPEQGSMLLINPMTAMAFMMLAREGKHQAMVNNAAASALGKMLIGMAARKGLPLISIVRRAEQVEELKELGATHVLDSSEDGFEDRLSTLARGMNATLFLDAIGGKESRRLLAAAPDGTELMLYARLSGEYLEVEPTDLILKEKYITGFQLGLWLKDLGMARKISMLRRIKKELAAGPEIRVAGRFSPEEIKNALSGYRKKMSAGKNLIIWNSDLN